MSALALGLVACQSTTMPSDLTSLASFHPDATAAAVAVPETVAANTPFDVTITTATRVCRQAGRTDVQSAGQVVVITIYRDTNCSQIDLGVVSPRTVSVRFDAPGTGAVRVIGAGSIGPQTVERLIVVR